MKIRTLLAGFCLAFTSSATMAAEHAGDTYGGVALNMWDIGVSAFGSSASVDPKGIEGRYGYLVNRNFAVEGRFGFGMSDDQGVEVSRNFGVYLKGIIDASENFRPYVMFGYTDLDLDFGNGSASDNDFSYGVGAAFGSGSTRFNVEWARLYSDSADGASLDIDSLSLGVTFGF